jgi:hypothetical protein
MQVIKEVWLLQDNRSTPQSFMCAQNTATPKLYVNERSALSSARYHADYHTDNKEVCYKPVKAFIVTEGEDDAIPF